MSILNLETLKQLGCQLWFPGSSVSTNVDCNLLPFPGAGIGMFDGNGDLLTCGITSDWSFLAGGTWTVECWFYVSSYGDFTFISTYDQDTYTTLHYRCANTGKIVYGLCTPTGGWWNLNNWYGSGTYLLNAWNHVAMVRNGNDSNSTIQCFLNGVLDKTYNIGNTLLKTPTSPLVIGSYCPAYPTYFNGYMSEIRVSNIARYTTNFTPPRRQLESDSNTKLLLHFLGNNATFVDSSPSPKTITAYGNATQLTISSGLSVAPAGDCKQILPFTGAGVGMFDGTGDYLSIGNIGDFDFGSGNFTIEFTIKPKSVSTLQQIITIPHSIAGTPIGIGIATSGKLFWGFSTNGSTFVNAPNYEWTTVLTTTSQYNVAVVRNGSTITGYVNGISEITYNISTNSLIVANAPLYIGKYDNASRYYNGYLSELRISNVARYTANFTPPRKQLENDSNTKLLLHFLGSGNTFVDSSPSPKTITAYGDVKQLTSPCGSGVYSGPAYTDYLRIPTTSDLTFTDNTDFTIEFWINARTRVNNAGFTVIGNIQYNNPGGWGISEWCTDNTTRYWGYWDNANGWILNGTAYYVENVDTHWAVVRRTEGSNKIFRLFRNGIKVMEATGNGTIGNVGYPFFIGQDPEPRSTIYLGTTKISELRISNTARYISNFTPSTQPFKPDSYTKLLLHMDGVGNAFYDASDAPGDNGFPILPDGVTVTPTGTFAVQKLKNGSNILKFDGSTNYVYITDHAAWTVGAYNFTICLWAKFDAVDALRTLLHLFAATNSGIEIYLSASAKLCLKVSDTSTAGNMVNTTGSATIAAATWYHIAVVRNGSVFTVYLNLVSDSTGSSTATVINPTAVALGCRPSGTPDQFMIGNIKDVQIFNGVALSVDQIGALMDETFIY